MLETGTRLTPAINLYEAMRYARIPLFGEYPRRPPRACITANHLRERHYSRVVAKYFPRLQCDRPANEKLVAVGGEATERGQFRIRSTAAPQFCWGLW